MSKRKKSTLRYLGARIQDQTLIETNSLRGDVPLSRWVGRALDMYNSSVRKTYGEPLTTTTTALASNSDNRKENVAGIGVSSSTSSDTNRLPPATSSSFPSHPLLANSRADTSG
jgi:hypothetical protein